MLLFEFALPSPGPDPLECSLTSLCLLLELVRRRGDGTRGGGTARGEDPRRPLGKARGLVFLGASAAGKLTEGLSPEPAGDGLGID